jgi:hypothetical protein
MFTLLRAFVHMLQIAAMVCVGFAVLALLEGEYAKKLRNLISRHVLAPPWRKAVRSRP